MILKPDLDAVYIDPFSATPMMILVLRHRRAFDRRALRPRSALDRQARRSLSSSRPASATPSMSAPKPNSSCSTMSASMTAMTGNGFKIDDIELPTNTDREYEGGNLGHRPRAKGGYFPVAPVDSCVDIRGEMVSTMIEMGLPCDKHHHEVAAAQHELGLTFGTLVADRRPHAGLQVRRPPGRPGLWQDRDVHAQADQEGQRQRHAHPLLDLGQGQAAVRRQRLCRPVATCASISSAASSSTPRRSTPSPTRPPTATSGWCRATKRRCCSPIRRATARPRAASPMARATRPSASNSASPTRWPTPTSCYAALLMAGLDGIQNKIHPGEAMDKNLYDLPPAELAEVPTVCGSLREALECARQADHDFLLKGGVFTKDQIEAYIELQVARSDALGNHAVAGRVRHVLQRLIRLSGSARPKGRPERSGRPFCVTRRRRRRPAAFPRRSAPRPPPPASPASRDAPG